jgi:hypothetical protein
MKVHGVSIKKRRPRNKHMHLVPDLLGGGRLIKCVAVDHIIILMGVHKAHHEDGNFIPIIVVIVIILCCRLGSLRDEGR